MKKYILAIMTSMFLMSCGYGINQTENIRTDSLFIVTYIESYIDSPNSAYFDQRFGVNYNYRVYPACMFVVGDTITNEKIKELYLKRKDWMEN